MFEADRLGSHADVADEGFPVGVEKSEYFISFLNIGRVFLSILEHLLTASVQNFKNYVHLHLQHHRQRPDPMQEVSHELLIVAEHYKRPE